MSHVHAFFMHTYHFCFYHIDIKLFGAFLRVSLSPSLFLALVCSMAPKRKSTPSRNPLYSGASSSSSNPTPSHIWFCDDKAWKDFSKNFSRRGIHLEHQVILLDFSDTDLPPIIYSRGWESLCDISVTCPFMIIQEFYSNMHRFDYSVSYFITCVWGTRIIVTPDIVSEVLCETLSSWGDCQKTPCLGFAKGMKFLNVKKFKPRLIELTSFKPKLLIRFIMNKTC